MPESNKGKEKSKGEEKRAKSPKTQLNGLVENKVPLPKYKLSLSHCPGRSYLHGNK